MSKINPLSGFPDLLPAQCEEATSTDSLTGRELQAFNNVSPRLSATYDLFGNGKTSIHASGSYYYATKITLANALGGLATQPRLRWTNASSGNCAASQCWNDANGDTFIQANELSGTPTANSSRFDLNTGIRQAQKFAAGRRRPLGGVEEQYLPAGHRAVSFRDPFTGDGSRFGFCGKAGECGKQHQQQTKTA